jgi:predicted lipid-binding transport protein (Tim44 family)
MAMIGVLIGLWLTGWAMGFMAMLGVLSLIRIVTNNVIVLIPLSPRDGSNPGAPGPSVRGERQEAVALSKSPNHAS